MREVTVVCNGGKGQKEEGGRERKEIHIRRRRKKIADQSLHRFDL